MRATEVTGTPRHTAASTVSILRVRRVLIPSMRRSVLAVTSGPGAPPGSRPHRYPAAGPLRSAAGPHASTAARYRASTLGAWCPTR